MAWRACAEGGLSESHPAVRFSTNLGPFPFSSYREKKRQGKEALRVLQGQAQDAAQSDNGGVFGNGNRGWRLRASLRNQREAEREVQQQLKLRESAQRQQEIWLQLQQDPASEEESPAARIAPDQQGQTPITAMVSKMLGEDGLSQSPGKPILMELLSPRSAATQQHQQQQQAFSPPPLPLPPPAGDLPAAGGGAGGGNDGGGGGGDNNGGGGGGAGSTTTQDALTRLLLSYGEPGSMTATELADVMNLQHWPEAAREVVRQSAQQQQAQQQAPPRTPQQVQMQQAQQQQQEDMSRLSLSPVSPTQSFLQVTLSPNFHREKHTALLVPLLLLTAACLLLLLLLLHTRVHTVCWNRWLAAAAPLLSAVLSAGGYTCWLEPFRSASKRTHGSISSRTPVRYTAGGGGAGDFGNSDAKTIKEERCWGWQDICKAHTRCWTAHAQVRELCRPASFRVLRPSVAQRGRVESLQALHGESTQWKGGCCRKQGQEGACESAAGAGARA